MFPLVTFSGGTPPYQNLCCHNNQKRNHTTLAWLTGIRKQTHNGALQNKTSHHRPVCVSCVVSCNVNVVQRRCYLGNCRASIAVFWISFSGVHLEEQLGIEAPAQWNIPSKMRIVLRQEADFIFFKINFSLRNAKRESAFISGPVVAAVWRLSGTGSRTQTCREGKKYVMEASVIND